MPLDPRPLFALTAAATLLAPSSAQAPRLLAVQSLQSAGGPASLVEIDLPMESATTLGQMSNGPVDALTWAPNGVLYAADNLNGRLVTIDPATGAQTSVVGPFVGSGVTSLEALTAHPVTGDLYGMAFPGSFLVQVDPLTAAVTPIWTDLSLVSAAGAAFSTDGSRLYVADFYTGELWIVDPTTGLSTLATTLNAFNDGGPLGIAVDPSNDDLIVAEWRNGSDVTLLRVDMVTLEASQILTLTDYDSIEGLTFASDSGLGSRYCSPAVPNSTGLPAEISAIGSPFASQNDVTLIGTSLPPGMVAFFIVSAQQGFVANPSGSQGHLCLGGAIGNYLAPGQAQVVSAAGDIALAIDLTQIPQPMGPVATAPGSTWNFQAWFRDLGGRVSTTNFTDGLSITFL